MIDYGKLNSLDYTAFEHVKSFESDLEERGISDPMVEVSHHYEDGVPVVNVKAQDEYSGDIFIDSYELENVNPVEFEELMYDIWEDAFKELEPADYSELEEFL